MNNQIALLADIHGNICALRAVLEDIEKRGIKRVLIAGDLISDCPDSNEVLSLLRKSNFQVIKGNREQYCLDFLDKKREEWKDSKQMAALLWTFSSLSEENIQYIRELPQSLTITIGDKKIQMVHGSPESLYELIFPDSEKKRFDEIMDKLNGDVLLCGHSHIPWFRKNRGKTAINPGSVGVHFNRNGGAEYAIISLQEGEIRGSLHWIPYNIKELESRFKKSGLLDAAPLWSHSIIRSLKEGSNLSIEIIQKGRSMMEKENLSHLSLIPDHLWDEAGRRVLD